MSLNHTDFKNVKKIELRRWNVNKIIEVIPCNNQESVSLRWVLSLRYGTRHKTTCASVAKGDKNECLHESGTESPTCAGNILQLVATLSLQKS